MNLEENEQILILEKICLDKKCIICYNNFINIKDREHDEFLDKITKKYNLSKKQQNSFDSYTNYRHYDTRCECLICKHSVCEDCILQQEDPDSDEVFQITQGRRVNGVSQEIYEKSNMLDSGIITCPVCRTKDFRIKIIGKSFNQMMPPELLYDIKSCLK